MLTIVVFVVDQQRFGLPLDRVERAVRVVEVVPLPTAPAIVRGVINLQGRIVPVINLRRRVGLRGRDSELTDHLLIAYSAGRSLAMIVDAVIGVVECDERDYFANQAVVPGAQYVSGIVRLANGIVLIHDIDAFLSLDEAQVLEQALVSVA